MLMKKLYKDIFLYSLPFFILIFFLFFVSIIKKDFTYAHSLKLTYKDSYNWFYDFTMIPLKKFYIKLVNDEKKYFPQIKFYVSESNLNYLLSDIPDSTKIWQKAKIIHDYFPKKLRNSSFRYRGDNPENWLFEKKSIRVKLKKKDMNARQRYYDYIPFEEGIFTSYRLASGAKILTPKTRLVEIVINEEKKGLYLEVETLNENFLRRNKIMPVNFYKGENFNQEIKLDLDNNLFNNSGLWSKEAYFNFKESKNKKDLKNFLIFLKKSKNNNKSLRTFFSYIDDEYFGRYLAYLIIAQDNHHDNHHNNRLILDPWKGQVFPVITDPMSEEFKKYSSVNFENSSNDLNSLLNQSSVHINLKYKYLYNFLYKDKLLDIEIKKLKRDKKNIVKTLKRDPKIYLNFFDDMSEKQLGNMIDKTIKKLEKRKKILILNLNKDPNATWKKKNNKFIINIKDQIPAHNIKLFFDKKTPDWVYIDENYNGRFDLNEIKFFKNKNVIGIDATLYSNRVNASKSLNFDGNNIVNGITKFDFITANGTMPSKITVDNKYSKNSSTLLYGEEEGAQSTLLNTVIHNTKSNIEENNVKILSGKIIVKNNLIFEKPVKIKEGTIFYLSDKANIIFKNRVNAAGTKENKIQFIPNKDSKTPWGSVVLLGNNTSQSTFNHVEFKGGSGSTFKQYVFTAMLSVHNTSYIQFNNINFYKNYLFDDMFHIVYSDQIELKNLYFENAFGDALDIDISKKIFISNSEFYNSANDGIDLMESDVIMKKVKIKKSSDKGISVGESSVAKIFDSELGNNNIAIAVKDNSRINIENTSFTNNKTQISAYKKNLQYGSGGKARINNSKFKNEMNKFISADSSIIIKNSLINGKIKAKGSKIFINEK